MRSIDKLALAQYKLGLRVIKERKATVDSRSFEKFREASQLNIALSSYKDGDEEYCKLTRSLLNRATTFNNTLTY